MSRWSFSLTRGHRKCSILEHEYDITGARRKVEEELRNSEQKYCDLVDTTPAFIYTASPDGRLDFLELGLAGIRGRPLKGISRTGADRGNPSRRC